jgi:serine/threonine protein kinase
VIEKSSLIRKKTPDGPETETTIPEDPESAEYEDLRWLIDREIQIMSALDHPHIIHLVSVLYNCFLCC